MNKRIKIFAKAPHDNCRYVLVPYGLYFNKDIKTAQRGDTIVFCESWRQTKLQLVRKCTIKVNTPVFGFMLHSLYRGWDISDAFFSHWDAIGINEGFGKNAVSREEIILIEVKDLRDGELE